MSAIIPFARFRRFDFARLRRGRAPVAAEDANDANDTRQAGGGG